MWAYIQPGQNNVRHLKALHKLKQFWGRHKSRNWRIKLLREIPICSPLSEKVMYSEKKNPHRLWLFAFL